jgi:hypothetical protein
MASIRIKEAAAHHSRLRVTVIVDSACVLIAVEPCIEVGDTKTPQFSYLRSADIAASRELLQGFVMNFQQFRSLLAVQQGLEPAVWTILTPLQ